MEKKEKQLRLLEQLSQTDKKYINEYFLLSVKQNNGLYELYLLGGADPNYNDGEAIKAMADRGQLKDLKTLMSYGADLIKYLNLSYAIKRNDVNYANFLLKNGITVTINDVILAIENKNKEMIRFLIEHSDASLLSEEDGTIIRALFYLNDVNLLKMALRKIGNKFPEYTFKYGESDFELEFISVLPSENCNKIVKFIIDSLYNTPEMFSNIYDNEKRFKQDREYVSESTMKTSIEALNFECLKFLTKYCEVKKMYSISYYHLSYNSKNGEIDKIIPFLLKNNLPISNMDKETRVALMDNVAKKCNTSTLELMQEAELEISEDTVYCAAESLNLKVVNYLTNKGYCCSIKDFYKLIFSFSQSDYKEQKRQERELKILHILLKGLIKKSLK